MTDIAALKAANAARWKAMHTDPALAHALDVVAARLVAPAAKQRYRALRDTSRRRDSARASNFDGTPQSVASNS